MYDQVHVCPISVTDVYLELEVHDHILIGKYSSFDNHKKCWNVFSIIVTRLNYELQLFCFICILQICKNVVQRVLGLRTKKYMWEPVAQDKNLWGAQTEKWTNFHTRACIMHKLGPLILRVKNMSNFD